MKPIYVMVRVLPIAVGLMSSSTDDAFAQSACIDITKCEAPPPPSPLPTPSQEGKGDGAVKKKHVISKRHHIVTHPKPAPSDPIADDLYPMYTNGLSIGEAATLFHNKYSVTIKSVDQNKENEKPTKTCTVTIRNIPEDTSYDFSLQVGEGKDVPFDEKTIRFILVKVGYDDCKFTFHW